MFLRKAAVSLVRRVRLPSQSISASASHPATATATALPFSLSRNIKLPYQVRYGSWWSSNHADPPLWIILTVHAALILGINVNPVLADDESIQTSSESDEQGANIVDLRKIEDGSVISNVHTSKWRIFTDNGRDYFLQGKLEEAEKLFLSAIQEAKEGFGERDPHVASGCNNLAELYRIKKAFDKAEPLYLEAISILEEAFGSEDIRVGVALHNLGQFYLVQRKFEEAQISYERALKIKGRVLGRGNTDYADTMYHLGMVLYLQGRLNDSEVLIQDSIRILEESGQGESIACIRRLRYLVQGQFKSTLVCPECKKVSITFDPFMYLSLPLPSTTLRTMTVTVINTDGTSQPSPFTITILKSGKFEDLIQALSAACSLGADETLLVAEIYNNRIIRYLEELADSISLIRDDDRLVAYRLDKDSNKGPLVVFMHQQMEEQYIHGKLTSSWKTFGIPLVARLSNVVNGSDVHGLYLKLLNPFQTQAEEVLDDCGTSGSTAFEDISLNEHASVPVSNGFEKPPDANGVVSPRESELQFYVTDEKGTVKESQIIMGEAVTAAGVSRRLHVLASWPEKYLKQYDTQLLSSLPQIFKSCFFAKKPQESVSLYKCLQAFLMEEPLGPEDMWYCPGCKEHRQASKKLDLWRLPEILVIHLKRFSYSRFLKNKLETYVDFPIDNLDLSNYIGYRNGELSNRYMLYAVSNHYGSMGGGHYTAFVHHGGGRWYEFDDSHVYPINLEKIKTSAAYLLFYRRVVE